MAATLSNGRLPRRQLSDQLDRLDSILDGLADALNDSVADAARQGVQGAVKTAVIELLTDPDLRASLHDATAPAAPPQPSFWERLRVRVRSAAAQVGLAVGATVSSIRGGVQSARETLDGTRTGVGLAWQLRKVLLLGIGIGAGVALFSYCTPHGLAAAISGAGAAATAIAVQAGFWARKTLRRLTLV